MSYQVNSRVPESELTVTSLTWEIFVLNISLSFSFYTLFSLWLHTYVHLCENKSQADIFSEEYQYSNILKWAKRYLGFKCPLSLNALLKIRVKILVNFSDLVNLTTGSGFMGTLYHLWETWTDCSWHWHLLLFAWGSFVRFLFPTNKEELPAESDSEQQPNRTCSDSSAGGVHLSWVTPDGIHRPASPV